MKYCKKCDKRINKDFNNCPYCGEKLTITKNKQSKEEIKNKKIEFKIILTLAIITAVMLILCLITNNGSTNKNKQTTKKYSTQTTVTGTLKTEEQKADEIDSNDSTESNKLNSSHEKINKLINKFYEKNSKILKLRIGELEYSEYAGSKYYHTVELTTADESSATFKFNANDELMLVSITGPDLELTDQTKTLIKVVLKSKLFPLKDKQIKSILKKVKSDTEIDYVMYSKCEISNTPSIGSFAVDNKKVKDTEATDIETTKKNTNDSTPTFSQLQAIRKAEEYLDVMAFSKKGLIRQLKYEGFSKKDATYAANHCGANWKEQAAKKAEEYLDVMSFSKKGLIRQLRFEGFTKKQAKYGVKKAWR